MLLVHNKQRGLICHWSKCTLTASKYADQHQVTYVTTSPIGCKHGYQGDVTLCREPLPHAESTKLGAVSNERLEGILVVSGWAELTGPPHVTDILQCSVITSGT